MGTTVVGGNSFVTIPFTSADSYVVNQVLGLINDSYALALSGTTSLTAYSGTDAGSFINVTVPGGVIATDLNNGTGETLINLGTSNNIFYAGNHTGGSANIIAAVGNTDNMTVAASADTELLFYNNASNVTAYLGGGSQAFAENSDTASANIYAAGSGDTAVANGAVIDASKGSTTVRLGPTSFTEVTVGGSVSIQAVGSSVGGTTTEWLTLDGSSTVAASVNGAAHAHVNIVNNANAFITPGASDIIIVPGSSGSATLFGGSATIGGTELTAPAFTGTATVFGGTGYYEGGSGGGNIMLTSTLAGSTTLIGGAGTGDTLVSYGADNSVYGGAGSDMMWDAGSGGDTLVSNGGTDTIYGSSYGNNTIGLGNDTTWVNGYGTGADSSASGNIYYQVAGQSGTIDYIFDFKSGTDVFDLTLGEGASSSLSLSSITYIPPGTYDGTYNAGGTIAMLSDGTEVVFSVSHVYASDFKTAAV